jgi:predicted DNA-binding transcriptional regulator YafY
MQDNAVAAYCGAPIRGEGGTPIGTLCHFDLQPCQAISSEVPVMVEAAKVLRPYVDVKAPAS